MNNDSSEFTSNAQSSKYCVKSLSGSAYKSQLPILNPLNIPMLNFFKYKYINIAYIEFFLFCN